MITKINNKLFTIFKTKDIELRNRVVMAPMTRSRAIGNVPNELMKEYYMQRSSAGLIISEAISPSPNGLGYARIPGIFTKEQIANWRNITDAVHSNGGKIFAQLMHTGRIASYENLPKDGIVLGPSSINSNTDMWTDTKGMVKTDTPEAMAEEDIKTTIEEFAQAAKNAMAAGFDGVEIHGANGYLPEQFLNPHVNIRLDDYGGNVVNRCRFLLEVTEAVANTIGAEKTGVRISPYSTFNSQPLYKDIFSTYEYLARELEKMEVLYIHVIDVHARQTEEGLSLLKAIRDNYTGLLIYNGGYTKEKATVALESEGADLISFGSLFTSNPDLPYRLENDLELTPPDPATFYTAEAKGLIDFTPYTI